MPPSQIYNVIDVERALLRVLSNHGNFDDNMVTKFGSNGMSQMNF